MRARKTSRRQRPPADATLQGGAGAPAEAQAEAQAEAEQAPAPDTAAESTIERFEGPNVTPPELRYWTGKAPPAKPEVTEPTPTPLWVFNLHVEMASGSLGSSDFNGRMLLARVTTENSGEVIAVPSFEPGFGFVVGAGVGLLPRTARRWGFWIDFEYSVVWLKARSPLVHTDLGFAAFKQIDIALRLQYRPVSFLAPYLRVAAGPAWFDVKGVRFVFDTPTSNDRQDPADIGFLGGGLSIGLGSTFLTLDWLAIDVYVGYRTMSVEYAHDAQLAGSLDGKGWVARLGPSLFF